MKVAKTLGAAQGVRQDGGSQSIGCIASQEEKPPKNQPKMKLVKKNWIEARKPCETVRHDELVIE